MTYEDKITTIVYAMYDEFSKKGHLLDIFVDRIGLCADTNDANEKYWRCSYCEIYQQSKCLSHHHQRECRLIACIDALSKLRMKEVDKYEQAEDI